VVFDYRTTINDAAGYTLYYLLYGREAARISEDHMEKIVKRYPEGLLASMQRLAMRWVWNYVAGYKNTNVETMNKEHGSPLPFVEFSVGGYAF
jgi:hypothetical protein